MTGPIGGLIARTASVPRPRRSFYASSALALMAIPQLALAADVTVEAAADFDAELRSILTAGSGPSSLSFAGTAPSIPIVRIRSSVDLPGDGQTLTINLQQSALYIDEGVTTVGVGSTLNHGVNGGAAHLQLGSTDKSGELHIDGGTVNIGGAGSQANQVRVGYHPNHTGVLRITNGGQLNIGTEDGATTYGGFFIGYNGGDASLVMDDGHITFGDFGASMRFGISANGSLILRNGSSINSELAASHFRVGEGGGGRASVLIDSSSVVIKGKGTNSAADDRYFVVGQSGGTGTMTQTGKDSVVHVSGIALIGIGWGEGSNGTYTLEDGLFEVGRADSKNAFRLGLGSGANTSTAVFNVEGGHAKLWGNLEIGVAGAVVNTVDKYATGTVNVSGGLLSIGGKLVFGKGLGTLNLTGGVLELGGSAAVTGTATSTVNFNGGTLRASSDLTFTHAATIGSNGAILDSNSFVMNYSGTLSGEGGVEKIGDGTLVLTGTNTYQGGTVIRAGTLQITDTATLGDADAAVTLDGGTLHLVGMTAFDRDLIAGAAGGTVDLGEVDELDFTGSLLGKGVTTFTNGGLLLTEKLEAEGEIVMAAGSTLTAGASNVIGADVILTLDEGAKFTNNYDQNFAGLNGAGWIDNAGTMIIGGGGASSEFSGKLTGNGVLTKTGSGTFTLAEDDPASSFTGTLIAEDGLLVVNGDYSTASVTIGQNGRFGGSGTIGGLIGPAAPGGQLAPGNSIGTLTVATDADLRNTAFVVEVDTLGASDRLDVMGTAQIDGATLYVTPLGAGTYAPGMSYTILTAQTDLLGSFASTDTAFSFLDADVTYTRTGSDKKVDVTLVRNSLSFGDLAKTKNQGSAADALDALPDTSAAKLAILQIVNPDQAAPAYDALSGEIHAAARSVLIDETRQIRQAFNDRLRSVQSGAGAESGSWALAFGAEGEIDGDGNSADLDRRSSGFVAGIDRQIGDWQLGAVLGTSSARMDLDARASSAKAETLHLGVYGGTSWDQVNVRLGLAYAWTDLETKRSTAAAGLNDELTASYGAQTLHLYGELGYKVATAGGALEPFIGLGHVRLNTDAYAEKGSDAALSGKARSSDTTIATLGLHFAQDFTLSSLPVSARGTLGWQHVLGDGVSTASHGFGAGSPFQVSGASLASSSAVLSAGIDVSLSPTAKLSASYSGNFASDSHEHRGQIGLNIRF